MQQRYDTIGWLVRQGSNHEYLREWRKNTTEEGLLTSESGSSDEDDD